MTEISHTPRSRAEARSSKSTKSSARASGRAGGRAAARRGTRGGPHKGLKIAAGVVAVLVLLAAGGGWYEYNKLNGNIKTAPLFAGESGSAGTEKKDAFGRSPINILAIGSDQRSNAADCSLGGACSTATGARADVEMVIHISADRSNATVMSIPRDLMTQLPACTDTANHTSSSAQWGAISAALNYGPGCSVAAVHQLTGIPIDHFMMVDFSGVVAMSDAVGGVSVCVDNNVYDPDSHLKLSKGTHTLKGQAALEFLRTRHGFGDGSDTQRTGTQHIFLNRMINNLKSAGTLTNVPVMLKLADTATNSLTVDSGLDGATKLLGLADELNKIPSKRITFITMQTVNDTNPGESGRLLIGSGATTLFNTITNDQSLTSGSGTKSASATAKAASSSAPPVDKSTIAVQVENGTGISDRAGSVATALIAKGFSSETSATTGSSAATTTLTYPAGDSAQAKAIAAAAGLKSSALQQGTGSGYVLVIGSDWPSGTVFPGSSAAPAPADTKAALAGSNSLTGADNSKCAHVSTQLTIPTGPNTGITPEQAYADHPEVPNSAP